MVCDRGLRLAVRAGLMGVLGAGATYGTSALGAESEEAASQRGATLEEVIIIARKREESILEVPVAAAVLSSEQIHSFAIHDVPSLTQRVPGLVIGENQSTTGSQISLRGIGASVFNPAIDQSVMLNVDGLGLSQGLAYRSTVFDVQQVEVLRGPQALYFGKNATAGVISVLTKNPGDEFEIEATGAYEAEGEEKVGEFIISGPVAKGLGLRLAARYSDLEGYFRNRAVGDGVTSLTPKHRKYPNKHQYIIRGTAVWEPTERFRSNLKLNYVYDEWDANPGTNQLASCPDGIDDPGVGRQIISPHDNCKLDKNFYLVDLNPSAPGGVNAGIRNGGRTFLEQDQIFGSLRLDYDLNDALTLSSVTGYYNVDMSTLLNGALSGFQAGFLTGSDQDFRRRETTQEIRLTSDFDTPLNFMVGGYYQDARQTTRTGVFFFGPRDKADLHLDIRSVSAFGQLLWDITPTLQAVAGARWVDEKRELTAFNITRGAYFDGSSPLLPAVPVTEITADSLSPEVSLTYTPSDSLTIFGSYREAVKSGSFDTIANPQGQDLSFGDESVKGFEGGIKSRWLGRTLAIDLSGYRYTYDDLQVGANVPTDTGVGFQIRTVNAAKATVYGVDLDVSYQPPAVDGLRLYAAGNWNRARYDRFDNAPCTGGQTVAQGCNRLLDPRTGLFSAQDLSGRPLVRAPEFQATFGFDYERPILNDRLVLSVGSSTQWSDGYYADIRLREDTYQDAFFKTSLSLSVRDPRDAWEVSLIGRNLNDEVTAANCATGNIQGGLLPGTVISGSPTGEVGIAGVEEALCFTDRPREVWLRFTVRPSAFSN